MPQIIVIQIQLLLLSYGNSALLSILTCLSSVDHHYKKLHIQNPQDTYSWTVDRNNCAILAHNVLILSSIVVNSMLGIYRALDPTFLAEVL